MIINRYLYQEILQPFFAICTLLALIFGSYSATIFLNEAAAGILPAHTVLTLILLKVLIALEILLPMSLYLAIIVALGRLHSDHEMVALAAVGMGSYRILTIVFRLSLMIALLVGLLSLFVRPWAYARTYEIENQTERAPTLEQVKPGHFFTDTNGKQVIFAQQRDDGYIQKVFLQSEEAEKLRVIYAQRAWQAPVTKEGRSHFVFEEGHLYKLDREGSQDFWLTFKRLDLYLSLPQDESSDYKRKAIPTWTLSHAETLKAIAEFQGRLINPLSTLGLGLLAVPLSRVAPRKGRYGRLLMGTLVFAGYYNLRSLTQTWVEQALIPPTIGMWWLPLLLIGLAVGITLWPRLDSLRQRTP